MATINRRRTTWWNLFFHYLAIGLMFLNGVLLVPLYLAKIPLEIYGYWLATGNVLAWISMIDPGLSAIIQQRVAVNHGAGDKKKVGNYLIAAVLVAICVGLVVAIAGVLAVFFLQEILDAKSTFQWGQFTTAFKWAVAGTALSVASFSLTAGGQGLQGALGPGIVYTATQVSALGLTIYWLHSGLGVVSLGLAHFVRGCGLFIGASLYLVWRLRRDDIICSFCKVTMQELVHLSGFTFFAKVPSTLAGQLDLLLAVRFLGPEAAAIFGLTRRGYDISRMIGERPSVALMPAVAHVSGEGSHAQLARLVLRMSHMTLWALAFLFAGFVSFNDDFIRLWIGEEHYAGFLVNLIFALGMAFAVLICSTSNLGFALGDVRGNSLANLCMSLIGVAALWISAQTGSMAALAAAPLWGLATLGIAYFPGALSRRLGMTRRDWLSLGPECAIVSIMGAILVGVFHRLQPENWAFFFIETALFASLFAAGLFCFSKSARAESTALWLRVREGRA